MISLPSYRVVRSGEGAEIYDYDEFLIDFEQQAMAEAQPEGGADSDEEIPEEERLEKERIEKERAEIEKELEKARQQAVQILEDARQEAAQITQQAEEKAIEAEENARREGYEVGHKSGYDDGYKKAQQEMDQKLEEELEALQNQMRQVIDSVTEEKERILERYLDDLKRICLAVSEKIIQTSLRSSGEVIKRMIVAATDKIKKTQWAKIYISKQDSEMIVRGDAQLLREMARLTDNLKVIAMENEEPGTCIIELPDEIVDASVNTQMENIKDILNNARL